MPLGIGDHGGKAGVCREGCRQVIMDLLSRFVAVWQIINFTFVLLACFFHEMCTLRDLNLYELCSFYDVDTTMARNHQIRLSNILQIDNKCTSKWTGSHTNMHYTSFKI